MIRLSIFCESLKITFGNNHGALYQMHGNKKNYLKRNTLKQASNQRHCTRLNFMMQTLKQSLLFVSHFELYLSTFKILCG